MILVTGASGTVGSETVKALQKRGAKFKAAYRDLSKAPQGVEAVKFDYDDKGNWDAALRNVETLFLLTPPSQPKELEQALALIEAAKKSGIKKIVKLSAMGVEGNPEAPHRKAELAIENGGFKWAHSRPTFFHNNFAEGFAGAVKSKTLALPAADGKTCFIDARNIGEANAVLLTDASYEGKGYALTGPEALTHSEACAAISAAVGYTVTFKDISDAEFRSMMKSWGADEYMINIYSGLYGFVRQGYMSHTSPDLKTLTGSTGISFAQFAKDHAQIWK